MLFSKVKYSISQLIILTICCLFGLVCGAQSANSNNYLELNASSINFDLGTTASLENKQVIQNAITLKVVSNRGKNYMVQVSGSVTPTAPGLLNKMGLQVSSTSANYTGSRLIYLTAANQQIGGGSSNGTDFYYMNLILAPLKYDIAPGTYTFTLQFTMTQQ